MNTTMIIPPAGIETTQETLEKARFVVLAAWTALPADLRHGINLDCLQGDMCLDLRLGIDGVVTVVGKVPLSDCSSGSKIRQHLIDITTLALKGRR